MRKRKDFGLRRQLFLIAAVIIVSRLICLELWGLDPGKKVDQYLIDSWGITDGIPSINTIAQTPDGYLWIGTSNGLVYFDGIKFTEAALPGKGEVRPQEISCLFVDRQDTLWIGSEVGLTSYRCRTGKFKTFTADDGITDDGVRHIKGDSRGNLWITFKTSYLNRFSNGEFFAYDASHGLLGSKINTILEDRWGNLLFGTSERGVFIYKDDAFAKYPIDGVDNLRIITMFEDSNEDLWIGTDQGLFRVKGRTIRRYTSEDGLTNDRISSITEDSDGNLWVGTIQGLNRVKKKQDGAVDFESLSEHFLIYYLFKDREESLWVGTNAAGIKRLKDGKFMSFEPLDAQPDGMPLSLFENRGDTWIGTHNGKLLRYRGSELVESMEPPGISGRAVAAMAEDGEGNLWIGTIQSGIYRKKNGVFTQFTDRDGLADNQVTSITRDSRGNLWFSTYDGVSVLRPGSRIFESFKFGDGLSGIEVYNVYEDKTHKIWIAADKGITVLKNGRIAKQDIKYHLKGIPITCIYEEVKPPPAGGSIFWIATHGKGLKRLRDGKFFSYNIAHGMTTDYIYQFLEDQQGNFWLMSDSGILRVSKGELNRFAEDSVDRIHCTSFGTSDGLKSNEFDNKFSGNSALKTGKGEFWFITKKGISIVNPEKIRHNKTPPPVVIEAIFFNDLRFAHYSDAGTYTLEGRKNVSFHFTAPTFLSPEKIKFEYRLQGYEREWQYLQPGEERTAFYKDLPPGSYTFKVKASSAEGARNLKGDSLTFTLEPFFYQTLLFKIAVFVVFMVLFAALFYIFKKRPFEKRAKYKGAHLNRYFADECVTRLKYLMDAEKVYCAADITLQALAEKMSIAPHQLSQLLNERLKQNFFDFINSYRIEEAKRVLMSPKGARQKIDAVAVEVGFNTMAAFYRAFKKHTGKTPTEFKEEAGKAR